MSENSLIIAAMAEAITLANAAAQAANDAVSLAMALSETISMQTKEDKDFWEEQDLVTRRRRRRRKSSREDEFGDWDSCRDLMEGGAAWSERSRYLTRRQEGEFSGYIKVKFKPVNKRKAIYVLVNHLLWSIQFFVFNQFKLIQDYGVD